MRQSYSEARENLTGAAIMVVAVGAFSLMDGGLKTLSPHYSAVQVPAIRGLAALPITFVWIALTGGFRQLWPVRIGLHVLRALIAVTMLTLFTYGVRHLPLSDSYAIFFVAPLLITAFAAIMLGERVDRARWLAIAVGFLGVLVVFRPTGADVLTTPGLAILVVAVLYAISAITVRILGRTDSTQAMVFWLITMMTVAATTLSLPGWRPIQSNHWWVIVLIAISGFIGQWGITEAFKRGPAASVAPLEYSGLAWVILIDLFVWSVKPEWQTLAGAAVIIGSGLYLLRFEARREV